MIYSILIASLVPLLFLYLVKWLNFFETHRLSLIIVALLWGALSVECSYLVDHPLVPIVGRPMVATHIGPAVEEIFKSLILLWLVRRADYTYFVDGAIYGFAVGVGFAVAENMLYLSRVDVDTGVVLAITRVFSASVMHGGSTALVGIAIGGFPVARAVHPLVALVIGWAIAIAYHMTYNELAFKELGRKGLWIICGVAFGGLLVVAAAILWGLRRERQRLKRAMALKVGSSAAEVKLLRNLDDVDAMLEPVRARFGDEKAEQVGRVLLMTAQLSMKQSQMRACRDRELQRELATEMSAARRALATERHAVGMYVMSYVRSIVPRAAWSLWARLGQTLATPAPASRDLWDDVAVALAASNRDAGPGVYETLQAAMQDHNRLEQA
jgi:RsiW-degrading membrane proteinase PrsW (M82 family)